MSLDINDRIFLRKSDGTGSFFVINGIIDLGSDMANNIALVSLEKARNFFNYDGVSSIDIQVYDVFDADNIAASLKHDFSQVKIESWQEKNMDLIVALRSQDSSSNIIRFFVLFSISMGIASVLGIAAVQKSRQLGILKAMGVDDKGAAVIFLIQGLIMGLMGSLSGIGLGSLLGLLFNKFGKAAFDLIITLPNIISPIVLALFASGLASLIPARTASKLSPIEVIRNG